MSCNLRPIRGGIGALLQETVFRNPCNDVYYQLILYYKFGTAYRQWLLNFDLDLCEGLAKFPHVNNIGERLVIGYWKKYTKLERCPFKRTFNFTVNADNSTDNIGFGGLTRMPEGDYKVFVRLHTKKNETLFSQTLTFIAKSRSGMNRTTMLTMG